MSIVIFLNLFKVFTIKFRLTKKQRCTMDISRIEAYNPSKINWKNMTAKEILKYKNTGTDVPVIYYQWAIDFINDVNKSQKDDITYEKATSGQSSAADMKNMATSTENVGDSDTAESITAEGEENSTLNLSDAKSKRKEMADSGNSLRDIGLEFTKDSIKFAAESILSIFTLYSSETKSNDEIGNLEGEMTEIITEAKTKKADIQNSVSKMNQKDNINLSEIEKLNQLGNEIQKLGKTGMDEIDNSEAGLLGLENTIDSQDIIIEQAKNFGSETVEIGKDLIIQAMHEDFIRMIVDLAIGIGAVAFGGISVMNGNKNESVQLSATEINSENIDTAKSKRHEVTDATGVQSKNKINNNSQNTSEKDEITGKTKEENKSVKTSQNDGTDTTDKRNISLDELVKQKVRRGEYTQET